MSSESDHVDRSTRWDKHMVAQVERSLQIVHSINPRCWSLHQVKGSPQTAKLTAGKANVLRWGPDQNELLIDAAYLSEEQRTAFEELEKERFPKARDLEQPFFLYPPSERIPDLLNLFRENHEDAVQRIARGPEAMSKRAGIFQKSFGDDLDRILRKRIPRPKYG